ncbi:MAG: ATP-grasp domain-containing protein [Proteobacteria bacterium]|nr:ATP-grasp domain-containing protein [Pseudomonadota bacterium]
MSAACARWLAEEAPIIGLGVETVAVFSDADAEAPHVREADQAVRLGPAPARESYLRSELVLAAAAQTGADAVHPGYGFLSENADFAEAVVAAGLVWVGPPASSIRAMGLKDAAKTLMAGAGVPVTPGYLGDDQTPERLQFEADRIGYPVLIKAVAGGGGKGMRKVDAASGFMDALGAAKREAAAAFGDDRVLLETYVTRPRHIEVQVFADNHGQVVHLFERDCSLQRRHQKVIEEAPAPGMSEDARAAVTAAAVRAAQAVGYQGAGTVEFIADASEGLRGDRIFFMEMNTRLQVEHPVTEMITGQDLVEWQLRVASGEPLPLRQDQLAIKGHAVEARLYAENPATGFLPSTGPLDHFVLPEANDPPPPAGEGDREAAEGAAACPTSAARLRVDSAVEQGGEVTVFYDPMIAKLIAHAGAREDAVRGLAAACRDVRVWPVRTNAAFLARCLEHPDFLRGDVDTGFITARAEQLIGPTEPSAGALARGAAELFLQASRESRGPTAEHPDPWAGAGGGVLGFRLNAERRAMLAFDAEGQRHSARVVMAGSSHLGPQWRVEVEGGQAPLLLEYPRPVYPLERRTPSDPRISLGRVEGGVVLHERGEAFLLRLPDYAQDHAGAETDGAVLAPMPGRIVSVDAAPGQTVVKGAKLVTLEAMKMEHGLTAPFDGVVAEVNAAPGGQVSEGTVLVRLEPT